MPSHHRIARVDNANKASRTIDQARAPRQPHKFPEVCLTTPGGGFLSLFYTLADAAGFTVALISIRPSRETLS